MGNLHFRLTIFVCSFGGYKILKDSTSLLLGNMQKPLLYSALPGLPQIVAYFSVIIHNLTT